MIDTVKKAAILVAAFALAGCKLQAEIPIYARDIIDVNESGEVIAFTYDLLVPIPSADKCDEYTAKIRDIVSGSLRKADPRGCFRKDFESFLKLRVESSIYKYIEGKKLGQFQNMQKEKEEAFSVFVLPQDGEMCLGVIAEAGLVNAMLRRIEQMHASAPKGMSFSFRFNNDLRKDVEIVVKDSFLDGDPITNREVIKVSRRDEKVIVPSNVREAFFWKNGYFMAWCLRPSGDAR